MDEEMFYGDAEGKRWAAFTDHLADEVEAFLEREERAFTAGLCTLAHFSTRMLSALLPRNPEGWPPARLYTLYGDLVRELYPRYLEGMYGLTDIPEAEPPDDGSPDEQFATDLQQLIGRYAAVIPTRSSVRWAPT
jgi:hypothetical protein